MKKETKPIPKKVLMARFEKRCRDAGFKRMWVHPDMQAKVKAVFDKVLGKR